MPQRVCVYVCLHVVCPPQQACTNRYPLNTLDLWVPIGYLGTLSPFLIPLTFRYALDTLNL